MKKYFLLIRQKGMVKLALWFVLLLTGADLRAQNDADFRAVDRRARRAPADLAENLPALTDYLTAQAPDELTKIRAIYVWITHHIAYDGEAYRGGRGRVNRAVDDILRRRRGVCFDYAVLFQAMCRRAGLACEVVSGYSRREPAPAGEPDHAWNAVRIDGRWRLLDATWDAAATDKENNRYFLSAPDQFVLDHLPLMPMWQLLDCPVPVERFGRPTDSITSYLTLAAPCYHFRDSIDRWLALPEAERRLREMETGYRFHPTPANRNQLGHAWIDYAGRLSDRADSLHDAGDAAASLLTQQQVVDACDQARSLADTLYPWQRELHVGALINSAVGLYQSLDANAGPAIARPIYQQMQRLLQKALTVIAELPAESDYTRTARGQAEEYLEAVEGWMKEE
jgi:hypothetical protein